MKKDGYRNYYSNELEKNLMCTGQNYKYSSIFRKTVQKAVEAQENYLIQKMRFEYNRISRLRDNYWQSAIVR